MKRINGGKILKKENKKNSQRVMEKREREFSDGYSAGLITKRMVGRLKDVHVFRGVAADLSDHFLVEAKEGK